MFSEGGRGGAALRQPLRAAEGGSGLRGWPDGSPTPSKEKKPLREKTGKKEKKEKRSSGEKPGTGKTQSPKGNNSVGRRDPASHVADETPEAAEQSRAEVSCTKLMDLHHAKADELCTEHDGLLGDGEDRSRSSSSVTGKDQGSRRN